MFAFAGSFVRSIAVSWFRFFFFFRCCFYLSDLLQFAHFTIMKLEPWFSAFFCSASHSPCACVRVCDDKIISNITLSLHGNWLVECDVDVVGGFTSRTGNIQKSNIWHECARRSRALIKQALRVKCGWLLDKVSKSFFFPVLFEYTIAFSRFTPHSLNGVLCLQQQYFKYGQWNADWSSFLNTVLNLLLKWWIWNINDNKTCTFTASTRNRRLVFGFGFCFSFTEDELKCTSSHLNYGVLIPVHECGPQWTQVCAPYFRVEAIHLNLWNGFWKPLWNMHKITLTIFLDACWFGN